MQRQENIGTDRVVHRETTGLGIRAYPLDRLFSTKRTIRTRQSRVLVIQTVCRGYGLTRLVVIYLAVGCVTF